jgi:hypothetical protein
VYGSLNFGQINLTQVTNYMADIWAMFQPVVFLVLAIAGIGALLYLVLGAIIDALRSR